MLGCAVATAALAGAVCLPSAAFAVTSPVDLRTASSFAVLAGSTVTNTGSSTIAGDVGVSPGTAITGFPPATVTDGTLHRADAEAKSAQAALRTAYVDVAGRSATDVPVELGGTTHTPGAYGGPTLQLTGTLTLDAEGDPSAVFVFQTTSTLVSASASRVNLINGADACHVFWQVGSSATLGSSSTFAGSILANTSISLNNAVTVHGRLLARTGAVTLINDTIERPDCATPTPPSSTPPSSPSSTPPTSGSGTTSTPGGGASTTPAGPASPTAGDVSPTTGPDGGGTTVTVRGSGFVPGATSVTIGGTTIPAAHVRVLGSHRLTFETPAHSAGRVTITVTTKAGSARARTGFTYESPTRTTGTTTTTTTTTVAETGTPTGSLVLLAAVLLGAGGAALLAARVRTTGRHIARRH